MPRITAHLGCVRWPMRGRAVEHPWSAWMRGEDLDIAEAPHGHARVPRHDEARYDRDTQTVIFRRGDRLTTCYSVREEFVTNDHGVAVRQAVEAQFGPVEDSDMRFTEGDS
jgi:hypothetical protein